MIRRGTLKPYVVADLVFGTPAIDVLSCESEILDGCRVIGLIIGRGIVRRWVVGLLRRCRIGNVSWIGIV